MNGQSVSRDRPVEVTEQGIAIAAGVLRSWFEGEEYPLDEVQAREIATDILREVFAGTRLSA